MKTVEGYNAKIYTDNIKESASTIGKSKREQSKIKM